MTILGIDPGLATVGYGVILTDGHKHKLVEFGTLTTRAGQATPLRLRSIFMDVSRLMDIYEPDEVAFEELFFSRNVTTAMDVGAARGAAIVAAAQRTERLFEYTPMQIKQAVVGYGKAEKRQVQQMVKMLLSLAEAPRPDDAADALAVAITHAHTAAFSHQFKIK